MESNSIQEKYNNFLNLSEKDNDQSIIDVKNDFPWLYKSPFNPKYKKNTSYIENTKNVSFAYVWEYKQTVSSKIANILNIIKNVDTTVQKSLNMTKTVIGDNTILKDAEEKYNDFKNKIINGINNHLGDKDINTEEAITTGSPLEKGLLTPYSLSYFVKKTNTEYIFPSLVDESFVNIKNTYGDAGKFEGGKSRLNLLANIINAADTFTNEIMEISNTLNNVMNAFGGTGEFSLINTELAKEYNFPSETAGITINFPLYNTVSQNDWQKNYCFISNLALKNMPWKDTFQTFIPPLLYRVIIPGQKYIPLGYVEELTVDSAGLKRPLILNNFSYNIEQFNKKELKVMVPEVWMVTIKFKSLISNTANVYAQMLEENITTE